MRIVGIDPGLKMGIAVIDSAAPERLLCTATHSAATIYSLPFFLELDKLSCAKDLDVVAVQVPFSKGNTPLFEWSRKSPVAFGKHCYLCGQIVGHLRKHGFVVIEQAPMKNIGLKRPVKLWCAEWHWPKGKRPPSKHARDAAQIAREALRCLNLGERITSMEEGTK